MVKLRPYVVAVNHVPECPRQVAGQGGRSSGRRRCAPGCERITDGWEVDLALRLPDGTPIRERVKAPVSGKSAALRWAQDREAVILTQRGRRPKEETRAPTLSEFKPRFIEEHVKANRLKPSSAEAHEPLYRTHLLPAFGELRLDALGDELVQRFKGELVEDELSSKSINNVLTALSVTLKRAVDWKVIAAMPCRIRLLKTDRGEVAFYDFAEYHRLVSDDGLQIRRGLSIGRTHGANRDADDHRRGPISTHDQAARWVNFLDTLMRHFLPSAVGGLALRVVTAAGGRRLVTTPRLAQRGQPARIAARLAAVLLAPVAASADVEHRRASAAAALSEAVVEGPRGT